MPDIVKERCADFERIEPEGYGTIAHSQNLVRPKERTKRFHELAVCLM
jgi:hypothetical protein